MPALAGLFPITGRGTGAGAACEPFRRGHFLGLAGRHPGGHGPQARL